MKIAGISISLENLPTKEQVYNMAITTNEFRDNPNRDEEISAILKASGLWKEKVVKPKEEEEDGLRATITKKTTNDKRK